MPQPKPNDWIPITRDSVRKTSVRVNDSDTISISVTWYEPGYGWNPCHVAITREELAAINEAVNNA